MKITRVLNNNVVLGTEDEKSYLLMGLSIGFKKKVGSTIPSNSIEKIFVLTNPKSINRLQEMINFIPDEYFSFCSDAVLYIKQSLKKEFSDNLYIMLTDHFYSSVERYRNGVILHNALLNEVKKFYKEEFSIALHIVKKANEKFAVNMGDDEAAFIAFHIVNAQTDNNTSSIQEMTRLIQEILLLIKNKYNIEYIEDNLSYSRFVTHLKYFSQKVLSNNSDDFYDEDMYNLVKSKYSKEYDGAMSILKLVEGKYGYVGTKMDVLYLAIHITRVING
jgi:beta-glucoside operon transcriptional antiterminator